MSNLSVVVAGVPALASALEGTGQFQAVHTAATTGELIRTVSGPELRGVAKNDVVFVFGDTITVDDDRFPLKTVVQKLTAGGWRVLVVALSAKAADVVRANPSAGLLQLPLTTNVVLGAMAGFNLPLEPVDNGFAELDLIGNAHGSFGSPAAPAPSFGTPAEPAPAPKASSWTAPKEPAAEPAPSFGSPAVPAPSFGSPAAPAPSFGTPAEPAPAPKASSWTAPKEPAAEPAPSFGSPAAPAPAPSFGTPQAWTPAPPAETAQAGWGATAAPAAPAQAGWGPPTEAPVQAEDWSSPARRSLSSFSDGPAAPVAPEVPAFGGWGATPSTPALDEHTAGPASWAAAPGGGPVARPGGYQPESGLATRRGMVLTTAVSKGGTGKSSLTINLAAFMALKVRAEGKTVCIIDTNFQQADTGKYLDVYTPNIMAVANDPTMLARERIREALVHKPQYNLSALLGPATSDEGNPQWITARLYSEILELLREQYDYIFIDTPVAEKFHSIFSEFALPKADFIIVPVAPSLATLHNADNWLRSAVTAPRHANGAGVDPSKIGVVLNRAEDNIGCSEEDVRANMARWNFLGSIPETTEWKLANNRFEIVATKNYTELSEAFATVLYAATEEPVLLETLQGKKEEKTGIMGKLKGMFKSR
jgi:MinD-like ATPase involved in chromosome partitioning or flagellar assembly